MSKVVEEFYETARLHGAGVWQDAMEEAKNMSHVELATAYADAVSLNAYYGKLENKLSAVPRQLFDKIKGALEQITADKLLSDADLAIEQGYSLNKNVSVPTAPLLNLLSYNKLMLSQSIDPYDNIPES
jgi:hypothetical protein